MLAPTSIADLQEIVHTAVSPLHAVGGQSKPALSQVEAGHTAVDMTQLSGILTYDPGEYLFTAYAGTTLQTIRQALDAHQQYLPFDPLLVEAGATLGGTVAANTAGSGRYRYGGVRDFILEVRWVNDRGEVVRSGGRVVKNSAGFDLPKFMVGSLGRYGLFTELTFKVFPQPASYATIQAAYETLDDALTAGFRLMTRPFEIDALDLVPQPSGAWQWHIRLGGLTDALPERLTRLQAFLRHHTAVVTDTIVPGDEERQVWQAANELLWTQNTADTAVVKIPLAPRQIPLFEENLPATQRRYLAGGNIAYIVTDNLVGLQTHMQAHKLAGLILRGHHTTFDDPIIGLRRGTPLAQRVKQALDPSCRFGTKC